jgi:ribosomal protein S18 acetylase RimI-like enzyme
MVTIEFTYDYDSKFLPIYREFFESEFTGRDWFDRIHYIPDRVLEFRLRKRLLERLLDEAQMPMMVIKYNDIPVGLSFPRNTFTEEEKFHFEVEDFQYYKIGSIIILRQYRNQGIAYEACRLFMDQYNPITYHVDAKNTASIRLAEKLGLSISHLTMINNIQYLVFK